jgi:hypothetical protein
MQMPPPTDELPDASYADAVFMVVTLRAAIATGLVAGAIAPFIPLTVLAVVGFLATYLFIRGTIDLATSYAFAPGVLQVAAEVFLLLLVCSSVLGAVMGAVRRWSVQRGISWSLLVGHHFSIHPGPHTVIAVVVVPGLVAAALHLTSIGVGHLVSIAPVIFFMFPLWLLSGFIYEALWEPLVFLILRMAAGERMTWLRREAALVHLLKDDTELFGCRLHIVQIDSAARTAHIRGDFRTPDHFRRVREIGLRVIGVDEVEAEGLTLLERECLETASVSKSTTDSFEDQGTVYGQGNEREAAFHLRVLRTVRNSWQALAVFAPRTSRNGAHDTKDD